MAENNDIMQKLQKQLDYCVEANRRATFKTWVFKDTAPCSATKLAEAGFIFTGSRLEPDSVRCFLCNKSLDAWDEEDDPWKEHQKHAPTCSFAKTNKPEKALTLTEFVEIRNEFIMKFLETELRKQLDTVKGEFDELLQLMTVMK